MSVEPGPNAGGVMHAESPSDPDPVRSLRHDLRTPVNHILGYSELLLEDLEGEDEAALAPLLRRLRAAGKELLGFIVTALEPASLPAQGIDLPKVCESLVPVAESIARLSEQLLASAAADGRIALDLRRIETASEALLTLLRRGDGDGRPAASPEYKKAGPEPAEAGHAQTPPAGYGTLLVVDDSEPNRDVLARRLERLGYQVAQAENGREALERLRKERFDLVLLDIMMPVMDGFEVLQALHADETLRHLPVIVLSALDETDSVVRCIEMGAEDYLPKPFDAVLLQARIGACLEKKRLRDEQLRQLATIEAQAAELGVWNQTLEQRVQEQVQELERLGRLRRFLSPQLAEMIASSGDETLLESHRREITVVFCDLRGFTAFAESAEPEEVMQVLREYHKALGELIFEYQGTLERFAGDGLMIFFNDPVPCADPPRSAVRMALAMREQVTGLQRRWQRLGYELGFGVGISVGHATLGRIGFEGRYDYAAIGTVTNLSARLCSDAAPGQILVSGRVLASLEDLVEVEAVGELELKGLRRPVPAFNVLGLKETS